MTENKEQKPIKFEDLKTEILAAINKNMSHLRLSGSLTLVEGFINSPLSLELSGSIVIGGPTIPMVMVVENETGLTHFFALKALIPDINL